ncbi:MAG: amidohydrolase family protein [Candidatus Melainabacteria bacterium]|nr:amidohydrolase family protein [Candidatus Melainabacteria bacterium]
MSNLVITGGHVLTPVAERFSSIFINDGRIVEIASAASDKRGDGAAETDNRLDATGCYVTPGLIDLQVNGDPNCSLWGDPTESELLAMRKAFVTVGVTSFLPTLITDDAKHLKVNVDRLTAWGAGVKAKWSTDNSGARMVGIHLEGPCLSPQRPGVHPPEWIVEPSVSLFEEIVNPSVKLVTMACERDSDSNCQKWLQERGVIVSLGHSNATYDQAQTAFKAGVTMMTHTFNALPPLHHREPGAVSAALLDRLVSCCVIADGLHLSPQAVELIYRMKGFEHTILVTDIAHIGTTGGGLVGSSITLDQAVRNVVKWGVTSFANAIRMATFNAAKAIGVLDEVGCIQRDALADLVIWDKETLAIKHVIVGGVVKT